MLGPPCGFYLPIWRYYQGTWQAPDFCLSTVAGEIMRSFKKVPLPSLRSLLTGQCAMPQCVAAEMNCKPERETTISTAKKLV